MTRTRSWLLRPSIVAIALMFIGLLNGLVCAARPGGDGVLTLTEQGLVLKEDGSTMEEYELRESDPNTAHFVSIGTAAHKSLEKAGYAYGPLVGIQHSDRDKEYGEGSSRAGWFPMVLILTVLEDAVEEGVADVKAQYEVVLDFDPEKFAVPGLAVLDARKLTSDGGVEATLDIPAPQGTSFFDRNRAGITVMFGVVIASALVKFVRRGMEILMKNARESASDSEGDGPTSGTGAPGVKQPPDTSTPKKSSKSKKKKGDNGTKKED